MSAYIQRTVYFNQIKPVYDLERNNGFDSSKAKRELEHTTRSYEETIRDDIQWLKIRERCENEKENLNIFRVQ